MSNRAWVTLATNDSYGLGALVLAHSLRRAASTYPAVVLITPSVTDSMRERLRAVFAEVVIVDVLDSRDAAHLALLQRPELGITFTKIHCWNLTQYEKCVFLDADTLVVQNCDELFEREELSAAPDVGWPDCFNSGVFVFSPSADTFSKLITFASERGSFDGGDQGLLNSYFSDWAHGDINKHLPFLYNVTSAAFYSYIPALKHYGENLKIIHFIGAVKPWLQQYNWESRAVEAPEHLRGFLQLWWDIFAGQVHAQLDTAMVEANIGEQSITTAPQEEVVDYSEPVLNYGLYEPILDDESEFPWHHPANQITYTEMDVPEIDMNQFHDPWDIYRGNIPPNTEDCKPPEQTFDYENTRKYAWDYMPSHNSNYQIEMRSNYEPHTDSQYTQDSSHHHHIEHTWQSSAESSKNFHQHLENSTNLQHHHNDYNTEQSEPHLQSHNQHSFQNFDYQNDKNQSIHINYQEPFYPEKHHYPYYEQLKNDHHQFTDEVHESQADNHILHSHEINHSQKLSKSYNRVHDFTYSQLKNRNIEEQVYTVMMDHVRIRNEISAEKVNGYASDDDSDIYEDIRPRHPYDGFYLRHRMTVDSRGRKICIHEVPFLPRSPSPVSSDDFEDALEILAEDNDKDSKENDVQTGVAGNLARVVPGAPIQREAVDELARRQGWEAGNIDYMGADSFDNIWAKISQTLSQPPTSPPEQQSSPQEEQTSPPESKSEQPVAPIEATPVEPTVEAVPLSENVEAKSVVTETPAETQVQAEVSKTEETVPESVVAAIEAVPAPVAVTEPESVPVPAEVAADTSMAESSVPVDVAKSEPVLEIPVTAVEALKIDEPVPESAEPAPATSPDVSAAVPVPASEVAPNATEPAPAASESTPSAPEPAPAVPETVPAAPETTPVAPEGIAETVPAVVETVPTPTEAAVPQVTETKSEAASDSPPLANTPSKEEVPPTPAAKSEERRKPAGKLQLPTARVDALPTPDSELEDAASLAHAIIASELHTPTVTSPTPPVPPAAAPSPADDSRLSVQGPEVPTPPVSLSQIGVKPKPSTAAQIESSLTKPEPKSPEAEAPKKKLVKKKSKESASSATSEAPVPPPRKKEKKPKEK